MRCIIKETQGSGEGQEHWLPHHTDPCTNGDWPAPVLISFTWGTFQCEHCTRFQEEKKREQKKRIFSSVEDPRDIQHALRRSIRWLTGSVSEYQREQLKENKPAETFCTGLKPELENHALVYLLSNFAGQKMWALTYHIQIMPSYVQILNHCLPRW